MRVAIVHDDLVQRGGAERVLEGLCEIYPDAPIYTSVYNETNFELKKNFGRKKIITSFIQKIPGWTGIYKLLLPLYPLAFEQFNFDNFDLVISHTTRFAKSIITKPPTTHLCYCHTPPRFLWRFSDSSSFQIAEALMTKLRLYDQITANRVDHFIAGSVNAKKRIKKIYKTKSYVVAPFVDLERFKNNQGFDGGYFLVISRLNRYKKIDKAIDVCLKTGFLLKIVGDGPQMSRLKFRVQPYGSGPKQNFHSKKVEFLGKVSDELVVQLLAGCKGLIIPGVEDFGLTALEAQALGKPVIAPKEGGALETVIDGKTGILFDGSSDGLERAVKQLELMSINPDDCRQNANRFSKENFIRNFQQTVAALV